MKTTTTSTRTSLCANPACGQTTDQPRTGRCEPCYRHFKKCGTERGVEAWRRRQDEAERVAMLDAMDHEDAVTTLDEDDWTDCLPVASTPTVAATTSDAFTAKVRMVLDLARLGPQAVAEALRKGTLMARLPRQARAARTTRRETHDARAHLDEGLRQAILADRKAGLSFRAIEQKHGIGRGNGMTAWTVCKGDERRTA
jgi:hypothetical protein